MADPACRGEQHQQQQQPPNRAMRALDFKEARFRRSLARYEEQAIDKWRELCAFEVKTEPTEKEVWALEELKDDFRVALLQFGSTSEGIENCSAQRANVQQMLDRGDADTPKGRDNLLMIAHGFSTAHVVYWSLDDPGLNDKLGRAQAQLHERNPALPNAPPSLEPIFVPYDDPPTSGPAAP